MRGRRRTAEEVQRRREGRCGQGVEAREHGGAAGRGEQGVQWALSWGKRGIGREKTSTTREEERGEVEKKNKENNRRV